MQKRILIADDDAGYRFPLVHLFKDYHYDVFEAVDRESIVENAPKCDIWVIDVRLPTGKQEGILAVHELVGSLRIKPKYPVIFISVIALSFCTENLHKLDKLHVAYEWIEKPFELEVILGRVNQLVSGGVTDGV